MNRRRFINRLPILSAIPLVGLDLSGQLTKAEALFHQSTGDSENDYWAKIRQAYYGDERMLDFNSGGLGAMTKETWAAYEKELTEYRIKPSQRIGRSYVRFLDETRTLLADYTNVSSDELAIVRNATEGLATAIFGIPLQRGDEVVMSRYDYPHVYYAWKQREARDSIVLKVADFSPVKDNAKKIKKAYLNQITSKTKAISVTDLINYNGCRVPTKEIIDAVPEHVPWRIVDAAQSFANTMTDLGSFGATHVAVSAHKWFGAPIGTGLLYVHKDSILKTWPLYATNKLDKENATRFEHLGTRDMATLFGIQSALAFQEAMGLERKRARLNYLSKYATEKLCAINSFTLRSPKSISLRSNLLLFTTGTPKQDKALLSYAFKEHGIRMTRYHHHEANGIRISINVFHDEKDIDHLVRVIESFLKKE